MLLWTIMSPEDVFRPQSQETNVFNVRISNVAAEVYPTDDGYRIRRIYSTNPRDYLNDRFMPGMKADVPMVPPHVKEVPPDSNWIEV